MTAALKSFNYQNKKHRKVWTIENILNLSILLSFSFLIFYYIDGYSVFASGDSIFKQRLDSGAFRDVGVTTPEVQWLQTMVGRMFQTILPSVSIISSACVMFVLIATVFYLLAQEFWDEVYLVKKTYKQNKASKQGSGFSWNNMRTLITQKDFVKTHLMPNIKAWAFSNAVEDQMTVGDFFKENGIKCILVFAFCITIGDQTMIDLFYRGGEIGAYFIGKFARDFDYVQIIDNALTIGSDYKPQWDTSQVEGRNKTRVFNAVYTKLKMGMKTPSTSSTEFKANVGQKLESIIENGEHFNTVVWDNKSFVTSAEYLSTSAGGVSNANRIYLPVETFGFNSADGILSGYIIVYIQSQEEQYGSTVFQTQPLAAWTANGNDLSIDLTKIGLDTNNGVVAGLDTSNNITNAIVSYSNGKTAAITFTTAGSGSIAKATVPTDVGTPISVKIINDSFRIIYKDNSGNTKTINPNIAISYKFPTNN